MSKSRAHQVHGGETTPVPVGRKERSHLGFLGTRPRVATALQPTDELEQADVACREIAGLVREAIEGRLN